MSDNAFEHLPERGENCPSELKLDAYHARDLESTERLAIDAHVDGCAMCASRIEERASGFGAGPEANADAMVSQILQATAADKDSAQMQDTNWLDRMADWLFPKGRYQMVANLALLVLVFGAGWLFGRQPGDAVSDVTGTGPSAAVSRPSSGPQPAPVPKPTAGDPDVVRPKGGLKLRVYRHRDGESEEAVSGEQFAAGDTLRFKVSIPKDGHMLIVGVETSGEMYSAYPPSERQRSIEALSGPDQLLAGAVELDDSVGSEWLHLVFCPGSFALDDVRTSADTTKLSVPAECSVSSFEMRKAPK